MAANGTPFSRFLLVCTLSVMSGMHFFWGFSCKLVTCFNSWLLNCGLGLLFSHLLTPSYCSHLEPSTAFITPADPSAYPGNWTLWNINKVPSCSQRPKTSEAMPSCQIFVGLFRFPALSRVLSVLLHRPKWSF